MNTKNVIQSLLLVVMVASVGKIKTDIMQESASTRATCGLSCADALNQVWKKIDKKFPCSETVINSVPYTISNSGHYSINKSLSYSVANGVAIDVNADDVVIEFCEEGKLSIGSTATGIRVNSTNVTILNGNFHALATTAKAISLSSDIQNWNIDGGTFEDFDEAIIATNFTDGTLQNSTFHQCRFDFHQTGTDSLSERFLAQNIRADYVDSSTFCPAFDFAANDQLSWAISLDGEVINSTLQNMQLNSTAIYCFKCRDCLIDDIELDYPDVKCEGTYGIQCGGPRGAESFILFGFRPTTPPFTPLPLPGFVEGGCINCKTSNVRVRMAGSSIFMAGIFALFCDNCLIENCLIKIDGGPSRTLGGGLVESYCSNCKVSNCEAEGPSLLGFHICDIFDINRFCTGSILENSKVRNCWFGINLFRCHAALAKNCMSTQNNIGVLISDGVTNATVDDCFIAENCNGVVYSYLATNTTGTADACFASCFSPSFTPDPYLAAPCNGLLRNSVLSGNRVSILEGPEDLLTPTGTKLVLAQDNNFILPFVDGCASDTTVTPTCDCLCITTSAA